MYYQWYVNCSYFYTGKFMNSYQNENEHTLNTAIHFYECIPTVDILVQECIGIWGKGFHEYKNMNIRIFTGTLLVTEENLT